ncbi:hypothetical protein BC830DRAFT_855816 [Chytriomyces sp. MP71]|nr:hypothetical protein BC830DRAFT_855816 [Chytriomyces sp. MP71]
MDLEIQTVAVTPVMESPNGTEIQPSQLAIESEAPLSATTTVICEGGVPSDQEAAQRVEIEAGSDNEDEAASNKVFSCPHPDCEKAYKYASGLEFHFRANVMGLASASSVVSQLQRKTSEETPAVVVPRFPPDPSKPYACPISSCGKGYANKGALSRHMNAGKHGVHADTGKRKSRRMVEDTDPVAPEAGGAAGEEDEAEVTVDEDEGAPPTKRLRARSRPACAGASAPNSARAASASGEAEKMSLDMLVNGGIDAAMAASDSLSSASLTPEDSSSIAVTRALHVTPKASSLRMRSRPTLSVNTPSRTPVSESQTESFRNVAISEQLASLATTEVDGAMVSLGEPDSFSEGAQKAAGSSSVDARSGKVDMASIAPAAESIVSSERGDAARTPSDTAVNASTASSSAQDL